MGGTTPSREFLSALVAFESTSVIYANVNISLKVCIYDSVDV
jgi:hypothetical protein